MSFDGARLELFGQELAGGQEMVLKLDMCDATGLCLAAIVRNAVATPDGAYRVGIEFLHLVPRESAALGALLRDAAVAS